MMNRGHRCFVSLAAVLMAASASEGGGPKDYTGKDLPKAKFANENLQRAKFDYAKLESADFTNAILKSASFQGADLRNASFRRAVLDGADFSGAKLQGAVFIDAKAWNANFSGTEIHLLRATLDALKAAQILGQFADSSNGSLSFRHADLRSAAILGDAEGVDFRFTDLRGANFNGAKNLDKAYFKSAKYDETTQWTIDVEKAGAVRLAEEAPKNDDDSKKIAESKQGKVVAAKSPFVGNWSIYRDIADPATGGELQIASDRTCAWKPLSSESKVLNAKWSEAKEDQMTIANGELGKTWSVRRVLRLNGKSFLELKTGDGETRVALPR